MKLKYKLRSKLNGILNIKFGILNIPIQCLPWQNFLETIYLHLLVPNPKATRVFLFIAYIIKGVRNI